MTRKEICRILQDIDFRDWSFNLLSKGDGYLLQVTFWAPDADDPAQVEKLQKCRKWYLSSHCCRAEVVRCAYKAIEAAIIHEAQESFRYRGKAIFGPHLDPDFLAETELVLDTRVA